jgi:hypothetical protein
MKNVSKEIIHHIQLTNNEAKDIFNALEYYRKNVVHSADVSKLANDFADLLGCNDSKAQAERFNVKYEDAVRLGMIEEKAEAKAPYECDSNLLYCDTAYIGQKYLIDFDDTDHEEDKVKFIAGKKGQFGIALKCDDNTYTNTTFFNNECARMIRNFILTEGKSRYHGYAAVNHGGCLELDLYIDNKGKEVPSYKEDKSLVLRYYPYVPEPYFTITKDKMPEIPLTFIQAKWFAKFVECH